MKEIVPWVADTSRTLLPRILLYSSRVISMSPPNILLSATRLLHHMGNIFRDNAPQPTAPTGIQIDRKRLQRLREKKMAMGHKWNDHEDEQNRGMGGMGL